MVKHLKIPTTSLSQSLPSFPQLYCSKVYPPVAFPISKDKIYSSDNGILCGPGQMEDMDLALLKTMGDCQETTTDSSIIQDLTERIALNYRYKYNDHNL